MSNAGTQLRSRNAALIPLAGIVLGAIDPAIDAVWATPKRNPASMPGRAHHFYQRYERCRESSAKSYALKAKKVKYWPIEAKQVVLHNFIIFYQDSKPARTKSLILI